MHYIYGRYKHVVAGLISSYRNLRSHGMDLMAMLLTINFGASSQVNRDKIARAGITVDAII